MNGVHMDKIEEKLDRIDRRIDSIDKHLAVYNTQLKFHIKRTDMLEEEILFKSQNFVVLISLLTKLISKIFPTLI